MDFTKNSCAEFVEVLGSKAPVPGGGGAAALVGAVGTALGNILCQLIALGAVRGEDEARKIVKNSCPLRDFFPA